MLPMQEVSSEGSSFSIVVIRRILDALVESGRIKKTNLAGKTGLNYPNCIRYIGLLELLGWVRISNDGKNHIQLTEQGIHFRTILSSIDRTADNRNRMNSPVVRSNLLVDPVANNLKLKEVQGSNDASRDNASYNIMLVDDEPDILLTFKIHLTTEGYNVEAFPDAKSALQNLASVGPSYYDLVITDIRMKSLNGLQLFQGIKSIDPDAKIVFISALDAIEELVSILPGVTKKDIIRKPIGEQEFLKVVNQALVEAATNRRKTAIREGKIARTIFNYP